jgi:hypothetical protein
MDLVDKMKLIMRSTSRSHEAGVSTEGYLATMYEISSIIWTERPNIDYSS